MSKGETGILREDFEPEFGKRGELRQPVGKNGRIHLDRWLPFLVLNRSAEPAASIARRIAINSPAYMVWGPEDDELAEGALATVVSAMTDRFGSILVITVADGGWQPPTEGLQELPPFEFEIEASGNATADVVDCLADALSEIRIDLREPQVQRVETGAPLGHFQPTAPVVEQLAINVPQIHRADETIFYPQITHDLSVAVGDALLQAACKFVTDRKLASVTHYRSLGRSAFLAAALDADKKLDRVAQSFDFLLSVSPINSRQAMERFFAAGADKEPEFRYRPLTVDPASAKRDLYAVDLSILEDPLLERLLSEKRQELDHQLTMLETRNTPAFKAASMLHYGAVDSRLRSDAEAILATIRPASKEEERVGVREVAEAARELVAKYRAIDERFDARVEIRDDVGSLLVSGGTLMIPAGTSMLRSRLYPLLSHEVSIHLLTYFNGAQQGLTVFRTGLAKYEGLQEGLGVFAEWAVGGLSPARTRLLAGRVIAVDAMIDGAGFVDVYRLLANDYGLAARPAFDVVTRVFRSGGFAKDLIYLKGFQQVAEIAAGGHSLTPFWIGKIAPDHVDAIVELLQRELVRPPMFRPEFLDREDVERRIDGLQGKSFTEILDPE